MVFLTAFHEFVELIMLALRSERRRVQSSQALTGPLNTRDICTRTTDQKLSRVNLSATLWAKFESVALAFGRRPDAAGKDCFPADVCRLTGSPGGQRLGNTAHPGKPVSRALERPGNVSRYASISIVGGCVCTCGRTSG
jgi:hypothetical protein